MSIASGPSASASSDTASSDVACPGDLLGDLAIQPLRLFTRPAQSAEGPAAVTSVGEECEGDAAACAAAGRQLYCHMKAGQNYAVVKRQIMASAEVSRWHRSLCVL